MGIKISCSKLNCNITNTDRITGVVTRKRITCLQHCSKAKKKIVPCCYECNKCGSYSTEIYLLFIAKLALLRRELFGS